MEEMISHPRFVAMKRSFSTSILTAMIIALSVSILSSFSITLYILASKSTHHRSTNNSVSFKRTNPSHLLFGIAGSAATWNKRSEYISQWWNPATTRGFVWVDSMPDTNSSIPPFLVSSPGWNRFSNPHVRDAARAARIIIDSFNLNLPNVRWFVMGDDDTVFFVENMATVLADYDHNQMWYIGSHSESVEQNVIHSFTMAFGGGGYAISFALAEKLVGVLDSCLDRYEHLYGSDERIHACVSEIGVPLSLYLGFHQLDIRGDPYGFLSAHPAVPIVSLHHLEYVNPLYPKMTRTDALRMALSSYESDPRHFLQQSLCYSRTQKWSIAVSWGYSVQFYPFLMVPVELQRPLRTFETWLSWSVGPFTFDTRTVSKDPCQRPVLFMFDGLEDVGKTRVMSRYRNFGVLGGDRCDDERYVSVLAVNKILVFEERYGDGTHDGFMRRPCCDLVETDSFEDKTMLLHLRTCKSSETLAGHLS